MWLVLAIVTEDGLGVLIEPMNIFPWLRFPEYVIKTIRGIRNGLDYYVW